MNYFVFIYTRVYLMLLAFFLFLPSLFLNANNSYVVHGTKTRDTLRTSVHSYRAIAQWLTQSTTFALSPSLRVYLSLCLSLDSG